MARVVPKTYAVAGLLLGSGTCALVYQIAWMREFRQIFGGSTAATAAVLAIFIAGLGLGGIVLGRRADRHRRPLALYARLELMIAVFAAATPLLFSLARSLYVALGGSVAMGTMLSTVVRVVLATLILAVPTFLMGGTLPAAARAIETDDDPRRHRVSLLYASNTLGAVTGCLIATFFLLEAFGTRMTLWTACAANLSVALAARGLARRGGDTAEDTTAASTAAPAQDMPPRTPAVFVLGAAALVGFAFFLMELVWYRMLAPLLGGTVFTFGLILAVALLGIGLGGLYYSLVGRKRVATISGFAYTCLLEALCIAVPFALGDRIAILTVGLRPVGEAGFTAYVAGWSVVTAVVVLPAAFVSGVQFPMLIALLGSGRQHVGRQIGLTYAWNTVGAILGALAGGFGLLPALTAVGCWKLVAIVLGLLGVAAIALSARRERSWRRLALPGAAAAATAVLMVFATGPTAAWRHAPIGAGRVTPFTDANDKRGWEYVVRRSITWEEEGVESSVAIASHDAIALIQNGKSDGNTRDDAGTQVMAGLTGALFHPEPRRSMVIGLGTGSTAGWLAAVPEVEAVDVVELEAAVVHVARASAPVNHDALDNPKVHVRIGDAREVLLTTPARYDLVVSEPSNPFRAGIASLFTREFYEAVEHRLNTGGLFVQWVQGYEIDWETLRTSIATLTSVFPHVEAYVSGGEDILFIASMSPLSYDIARLRKRFGAEPWSAAAPRVWRTWDLEAMLARRLAGNDSLRAIAAEHGRVNTDDHNIVEFGFAKALGRHAKLVGELTSFAHAHGDARPVVNGEVDWTLVERHQAGIQAAEGERLETQVAWWTGDQSRLGAMYDAYLRGKFDEVLAEWRSLGLEPKSVLELAVVATALAVAGDDAAQPFIERLKGYVPGEAMILLALLHSRQGHKAEAASVLTDAFISLRSDPWPIRSSVFMAFSLAHHLASTDPAIAERMFETLGTPFAVSVADLSRGQLRVDLLDFLVSRTHCVEAFAYFEPYPAWTEQFLANRERCYRATQDPHFAAARRDLAEFRSAASH